MKVELIALLRQMNFTEYEAKAYLALLEKSPLSGYAVALNSGIPRSKIYQVLGTLLSRGDIVASQEEVPLYSPIPYTELLSRRKRAAEQVFSEADSAFENYTISSRNRDGIWNISGHDAIRDKAIEIINAAQTRLLLEAWAEDINELKDALENAAGRGVLIQAVVYGDVDFSFAEIYQHDSSEEITEDYGGRWLIVSSDNREIVAGIVSLQQNSRAAWTLHPGLVMPITEVIIHDLYLMEILKEFRPLLENKFGVNLKQLRDKFSLPGKNKNYY